ncbi:tRNA pseudouridine(38-40) synthase TruA [Agitococcus lubricus]|uniref:tRNA pseudouridine synthase A n=1 Tax=Agitococcus lubricus TaxID=1077255 RepID=A0A2T5IVN5_9GAMM|nr:tRNA pseudouridine(38-40) synthase TruA [Agitococcus lubricus]PTQ87962.1 tRNA pseudouridine38-40 synthase [Agitococcus lubricus]
MTRFAVGIDYDGSHYRGWQTQQEGIASIQSTLEQALSKIANHPVILHAAGRTDAGVHAAGMIAHFDTTAVRGHKNWLLGTNTLLPPDIALRWLQPVSDDFHARFKAIARRYRYVIFNSPQRSSQLAGKVTWHYHPLNVERMQLAARYLVGHHNFNSFRAVGCQSRNPNRHVHFLHLTQRGSLIILDIQADGFLHHMVRNIAGVLMAIGQGKAEPEWVQELLAVQDRTQGGVTASGSGLYFVDALYPPQFMLPKEPIGPIWLADLL